MVILPTIFHQPNILFHLFFLLFGPLRDSLLAAQEDICGELEVHKQQWIDPINAIQLGQSQRSSNLSDCLQRCCAIADCSAVTFAGFMGAGRPGQPANCTLFRCTSECKYAEANGIEEMNDGVLSVRLRRPLGQHENEIEQLKTTIGTIPPSSLTTATFAPFFLTDQTTKRNDEKENGLDNNRWPSTWMKTAESASSSSREEGQIMPLSQEQQEDNQEEKLTTKTTKATNNSSRSEEKAVNGNGKSLLNLNTWDERFPLNAEFTPVWAIGLAIVVTVVSLGLLMTFLGSLLFFRRYRSRMRSTEISGGGAGHPKKMPTLHAFNPN